MNRSIANVRARVTAYLADSIVFLAFLLVFFFLGGVQLLIADSRTDGDPSDAAFYAFIGIAVGGAIIAWSVFNLALMQWRGQTAGMFVIGIKAVAEDETPLTMRRTLLRWFGLHPLLYHPFLLPGWLVFALLVTFVTLSQAVLVITLGVALLCVVAPILSLVTALLDDERRTLHDRLAHTVVIQLEQQ